MSLIIICHELMVYVGVVCPTLDDPNDGRVVLSGSSATFMSNATYSCNERFILIGGDDVRTCQANRTWSGSEPTCIGKSS